MPVGIFSTGHNQTLKPWPQWPTCQVTWHFAASTWAASESPPWTSQRGSGSPTRRGIAPSGQDPHPQVYLGNASERGLLHRAAC